jgi:hypothetical protein
MFHHSSFDLLIIFKFPTPRSFTAALATAIVCTGALSWSRRPFSAVLRLVCAIPLILFLIKDHNKGPRFHPIIDSECDSKAPKASDSTSDGAPSELKKEVWAPILH